MLKPISKSPKNNMIYKNSTIEISIGDYPVVSDVELNVISKFEIDRPRFDGPIDIKFFRSPLILPSLLPSLFFFSSLRPLFFSFLSFFLVGSHLLRFLAPFPLKNSLPLTLCFLPLFLYFFFFLLSFRLHPSKPSSTSHVLWESGEVGDICGCVGDPMSPTF